MNVNCCGFVMNVKCWALSVPLLKHENPADASFPVEAGIAVILVQRRGPHDRSALGKSVLTF